LQSWTGIFIFELIMHILIAPNAFKNSLSAPDASEAIRLGLLQSGLVCSMECFPVGDGGDGTASLIVERLHGFFDEVTADDPVGRKIKTSVGFIDNGKTAVIEMADISGLKLLRNEEFDPLHVSSFGTGELIRKALEKGALKIMLGIGGSATVDGGCGALRAVGIRFLDKSKKELAYLPENLINLDSIDISGVDKRIWETELIILCDVDNFLLGEKGAAMVFGPQKGASDNDIVILEKALQKLRDISLILTGKDMNTIRHGGAAGGTAAGMNIFLNARLEQGIEYFLDITGFDKVLQKADLVITGEGSIDLQTLEGKGPFGVARRAKKKSIPVIGVGGQVSRDAKDLLKLYFDELIAINNPAEDINTAMKHTAANLLQAAYQIGNMLKPGK
jgi:glycerate kinase